MKVTPFNEDKFKNVTDRLHLYETGGVEPEVKDWVEKQQALNELDNFERKRALTDTDIRNSLILQFKKLNTEKLSDKDKTKYDELCLKYGL